MLYLKNRNRYRHVLGTEISAMANFIFTSNTFMGLNINAFQVIQEKTHFWADILDFGGRPLGIFFGTMVLSKEQPLRSMCTNFGACIRK